MKLRARLLFITICALLVPVLVAIAVAAAVVVESSGRSQETRFRSALDLIRKDIADTEQRYRTSIARLALSRDAAAASCTSTTSTGATSARTRWTGTSRCSATSWRTGS